MNNLNNIKVYNSKGDLLNSRVEDNTMLVYINMSKVSVNLIQSETLYILEKVHDGVGTAISKPKFKSDNALSLSDKEFSLFTVDHDTKEISTEVDKPALLTDFIDDTAETYTNGYRDEGAVVARPMTLNIMFKSNDEGNYTADLVLSNSEYSIVFVLYCESEGTDERLINLLNRFGENISQNEEIIFRESDIADDLQSHIVLNQKRKDLLNNIDRVPYLSSIKGLEFIIEFFGYDDIMTIKEFYYDSENDKFVTYLHDDTKSNRTKYQKLSNFGLFYQLNKVVDDEVDTFGNPITEDVFTIPIEEVIIKFLALKNYIESRNIGGVSRIIDVVGERVKFSAYKVQTWNRYTQAVFLDKQTYPEMEILEFTECIVDLRNRNIGTCTLDPDDDLNQVQIGTINNCYIGYFANYYQEEQVLFDEPDIEVGAVAVLRNTTFDITWEEVDVAWVVDNQPITINWLNAGGLYYHTTKFRVKRNGYDKTITIDNTVSDTVEFILPLIGKYDVTVELIGYNNLVSKRTFHDALEVKMKEVEFMQFYKIHDKNLQVWDTCWLSWEEIHSDWNAVVYDNGEFTLRDGDIFFQTYELINYALYGHKGGYGNLNWLDYNDNSWNGLEYLSWLDLSYETKKLAYAIIDKFQLGNVIQINELELEIPTTHNLSNYAGLAQYFSTLTTDYTFTHKIDYLNNDFIEVLSVREGTTENFYIATSGITVTYPVPPPVKNAPPQFAKPPEFFVTGIEAEHNVSTWDKFTDNTLGVWNDMIINWENTDKVYKTAAQDEEFTLDNTRFYKNEMTCPKFVPVFFTIDDSRIAGKTEATYTILDQEGNVVDVLEGRNVCKRFEESGIFTIECSIRDTNGNEQKLLKENIIKITDHDEFRRLQQKN